MSAPLFFAAGAVKTAVEAMLGSWPGVRPVVHFGTVGALRDRILRGEAFDATVLSAEAMAAVAALGHVSPGTITPLGTTGIGIAIRAGLDLPGIGTQAGLVAALQATHSIAWADPASGATAGRHFAGVIGRLGLSDLVSGKSRLYPFGVEAVSACERGEVDIAISQATEILGRPGVRLHGLFPPPHALATAYEIAGHEDGPAARGIIAAMTSPPGRAALAAIGFSTVEE